MKIKMKKKMILSGRCEDCRKEFSNPFVHACISNRHMYLQFIAWVEMFLIGLGVGYIFLAWVLGLPFTIQQFIYPFSFLSLALYLNMVLRIEEMNKKSREDV